MIAANATALANFERMLAQGKDSALLRFSLGNEYMKAADAVNACVHLGHAVRLDPDYTAAWKLYGRALAAVGHNQQAADAYREGRTVAQRKGDKQAFREMDVFLRRIERGTDAPKIEK